MRALAWLIIPVAVVIVSCAGTVPRGPEASLNVPPTEAALALAEYGVAPDPGHREELQAEMATLLKDPESARYRFGSPERTWLPRHLLDEKVADQPYRHGHIFGWKVDFGVNAKNSYGGYTGEQSYEAFFQDGRLRAILRSGRYTDIFGYPTWDLVASVPR